MPMLGEPEVFTLAEVMALQRPLTAGERRILVEAPLRAVEGQRIPGKSSAGCGFAPSEPVRGALGFVVGSRKVALRGGGEF